MDWNNVTWANKYSNTFNVDDSFAGNDLTIAFSDPNNILANAYPSIDTTPHGGLPNGTGTLDVEMQLASPTDQISVKVTFHYTFGVKNVSFSLFDVDFPGGGQPDQLRNIYARDVNGNFVAPQLTGSLNNVVAGSGTNQTVTGTASAGNTSDSANVLVNFGTNEITEFYFNYGVGPGSGGSGGGQIQFWWHDITYTPVPEVGTTLATAGLCSLSAGMTWWRRRRALRSAGPSNAQVPTTEHPPV